ncbi:MAG: phosphodiester glycosidase family protein [Oscillospiraceae bacterium]|nr:phosphodiester glycosidase family protein [Oscillospiraceae bacterium]
MQSQITTVTYDNAEIQRTQVVRWESWEQLEFLHPKHSPEALDCFAGIYRKFLVPACPWLFGNMVLFRLPEDLPVPFPFETRRYGRVSDRLTAAAAVLEEGLHFRCGKPKFRDKSVETFYKTLENRGCLRVVRGKLPVTTIIPVGNLSGFLTEQEPDAQMKVNASFFIMDRFDCATVYDHLGIHLGLCVRNGVTENPPLYDREAFLVYENGSIAVKPLDLAEMEMEINGVVYRPGQNARLYTRPASVRTSAAGGKKLVIVGCRVAAVAQQGSVPVPASGFVLCPKGECTVRPGDRVVYRGLEDVRFGIQVGNSILRDGVSTNRFVSKFYNIRKLEPVPYPPSLYPMNFRKARAARIALGADKGGKPMLLWAEGAAKIGYVPGQGSCGASLWEMARLCADAGMYNAVNLDGGGSAQILLKNCRSLMISDRTEADCAEAERPVPLGLIVR